MRYIQDPVTFKLIPADQYHGETRTGVEIMGDIEPYRSMIDGSIITSRSKHRAHLRQHGCEEVGNDSSLKNPHRRPLESPPGLKQAIADSIEKHLHHSRRKTRITRRK